MAGSSPKPTLLVVEDNAVTIATIRKVIKSNRGATIELVISANGKDGIEAARNLRPDLVLLDLVMPDFNGEYFLREQARDQDLAKVPVLLFTALAMAELSHIRETYPAVKAVLQKQTIPTKLLEMISPFLKSGYKARIQREQGS